jgi:hypothetical protein
MLTTCVLQSSKGEVDATPAESEPALKKRLIALVFDSDDVDDEQAKGQNPTPAATTPRKPSTPAKPRQSLPGFTKAKANCNLHLRLHPHQ